MPSFGRNVGTLLVATVAAQAIPIALSPLYTRIFSPEAFGAWAAFTAVAAILAVAATGRFELAVLLPAEDSEAAHVVVLGLGLALVGGLLFAAVGLAFREPLAALFAGTLPSAFIPLVGISAALLGCWQVLSYWANRRERFARIGASAVIQQTAAAAATLGLGLGLRMPGGLVAGTMTGQATAVAVLGGQVWREDRRPLAAVTLTGIRAAARRFYRFPLYNLPYSVLTTASVRIPVLLLTGFGAIGAAGFVGFSRSVLFLPVTFVSASLGRVYFRTASTRFGTPGLERLTVALLELMSLAGPPVFAFLIVWTPEIFAAVFGEPWREAGELARPLIPSVFGFLFTSWPERIFEVAERQRLALAIQAVGDAITIGVVALLLARGASPLVAMVGYGALSVGCNFAYLWGVFRAGGFSMRGCLRTLGLAAAGLTVCVAGFAALRWAVPSASAAFVASLIALVAAYLGLWRWRGAGWRQLLLGGVA